METVDTHDPWAAFAGLPGNPLMWVLILSELAVFAAAFLGFAVARLLHPDLFAAGQASLSVALGGANTLVLVTSGWCAAKATANVRAGGIAAARRWLGGAATLGMVFVAIKLAEYGRETAAGHGLTTDTFFTLFFLLTGFHLIHVVAGIVLLAIVARWPTEDNVETGASFWHMVDLVWLVLFPLVYLLR